jgi:hypothetical protein
MASLLLAALLAADPTWSFCGRATKQPAVWSFCAPKVVRPIERAEFIESTPVEIREATSYPVYQSRSFSPCPGGRCVR